MTGPLDHEPVEYRSLTYAVPALMTRRPYAWRMSQDAYVERMRRLTKAAFTSLHAGVSEVVFADFPDYSNVGDSAIALGQADFWSESRIDVRAIYTAYSFSDSAYDLPVPVVINGGGSLGGLYGFHNEHRYQLAERLNSETVLIQAPQSVHFPDEAHRREFGLRFARRPGLRLAVRDDASLALVQGDVPAQLSPDAAHLLGQIPAPDPTRKYVVLARRDRESASRLPSSEPAVDWVGGDSWWLQRTRTLNEQAHRLPGGEWLRRPTPRRWLSRAERRLRRGVRLLSPAETVVTDRLHGMLLALQMGRRVIAVDNNNQKLTAYADTWFGTVQPDVTFARSLEEAVALV